MIQQLDELVALIKTIAEGQGCAVEDVQVNVLSSGKRKCLVTLNGSSLPVGLSVQAQQAAEELAKIGITCRVEG